MASQIAFDISQDGTKLEVFTAGFHVGDITMSPPQVAYTYLRPDGTSKFFRPDSSSLYIRP